MRLGLGLTLAMAGGAALAQQPPGLAPQDSPVPESRPDDTVPRLAPPRTPVASGPAERDSAGPAPDAVPQLIPPRPREPGPAPEGFSLAAPVGADEGAGLSFGFPEVPVTNGEAVPSTTPAPEPPAGPPMREVLAETPAELSACLAALDDLGVAYARADPVTDADDPDCGIANPLTVSAIAPGVALDPPPVLRCEAALAAAHWVAEVVLPSSRKLPDRGDLAAIDQGTAYLCRPRADGEISEHAFGNALDVMGFRFARGDPLPIQPRDGDGTLDEAFQAAVRAGACLDFTTVLGPGQEDHADHLHLDVKARDSGFRICE